MFRESCKFSKSYRKGPWSDSGQFCACPHLPSCLCWEKPPSGCRAWHWLSGWEQLSSSRPHPCSLLLSASERWACRNTSAKILPPFRPEFAYGCGYFNFFSLYFFIVWVFYLTHVCVPYVCLMPTEARRGLLSWQQPFLCVQWWRWSLQTRAHRLHDNEQAVTSVFLPIYSSADQSVEQCFPTFSCQDTQRRWK